MTTTEADDAEGVIDVNRDIECEIYAVRGGRLAGSPAPRVYVTLAFDAVTRHSLGGLLLANLKGQALIHVVNLQAPLPDEPDDEPKGASSAAQMALVEAASRVSVLGTSGERIFAHGFVEDAEHPENCGLCDLAAGHEILSVENIELLVKSKSRAMSAGWGVHFYEEDPEQPGLCRTCHHRQEDAVHDIAEPVSDMAQSLIDESRVAPSDAAEAQQQVEAEASLAHRGRR